MTNQEKILCAFFERRIDDFRILLKYWHLDVDYFYGEPHNGTLLDLAYRSPGNELYITELLKRGAKLWSWSAETGKLEVNEIFNSSDRHLLYKIWRSVYWLPGSRNYNAYIMIEAVKENEIEAIELLARSYSIIRSRFGVGHRGRQHLILLLGSIDAVRLFIKYFDVNEEFQKDSQGGIFTCREIILQKYPELETELPTRTLSASRKVAVEESDIEVIKLVARSYPIICDVFNYGISDCHHLIQLLGSIDAVRLFIKYFDVDKEFQKDSQGLAFSCRDIILQKYPELEAELPTRSPSELQEILFLYLDRGVPEVFVRRIAKISTETLNDGLDNFKKSYLYLACKRNYINVVDALLEKNVHLNEPVPSPIIAAAFEGHYEIFKKLYSIPEVDLEAGGVIVSVLHSVLYGMQIIQNRSCPIVRCCHGHRMILELLLKQREPQDNDLSTTVEHTRLNIELKDSSDKTALHYALKFNNEFAIKLLLGAGAKLYPEDQSVFTSISATIIEGYFDECIRSSRESIRTRCHENNPIIFHYKIFTQLDLYSIAIKSKGNFIAVFESVTEMRKLYKHPLAKSFLYLKWCLFGKFYYINLIFYLSFCFALSAYIFQIQHCLPSSSDFKSSESTDTAIHRDASFIPCDLSLWIWLITLLLYMVLILRELCQFFILIPRYLGGPENWWEVTTIVATGFLFANGTNTNLAAIAILTSWIGLILLLGKQPLFSIYIEMFKTVALNSVKFLLLYSILVASFAYSFFILFRNKTSAHAPSQNQTKASTADQKNENSMNSWQDLQMSFFKSIIMMTGEFEASTLPLDSNFSYGHVLFVLFVFLVTMVLYNLLNGLAVSDTRAIMEDAEVVALISRAKLISQIERLAISNPFRHAIKCRTTEILERRYLFLRDKLFGLKMLIDETKEVYVYPTKSNGIGIISGKNFGKMPSTIVKHAEQIVEKRKQSKKAKDENQNSLSGVKKINSSDHKFFSEFVHQFSEQINDLKLEIDAKNSARDEKLLQYVDQRFDEMMNKLLDAVLQKVGKSSEE